MPLARPPLRRAVVVVPAHDEAELLPACLAALRSAAARVVLPVEVVVVLDACTDASATLVGPERVVVLDRRCVGAARAAGFAAAVVDPATWCASTDADSAVGPSWLAAQLDLAAAGADVVVGTVVPAGWAGHPAGVRERFEGGYHRADGHRHVHGASLGVRGSTYLSVGGFAPLRAHEDVDLVARAGRAGAAVRWAGEGDGMVVTTSTRTVGRAPEGFAAHLRGLATGADALAPASVRGLAVGA